MAEPTGVPVGELIVQNGKRKGVRLPLRPVTSIGSAAGCDIRLSGEGVLPVHCVIALNANGPTLRAGFATGITLVNGSPQDETLLADGDEMKVGPCVFQVACSVASPALPPVETIPLEATQIAEILEERQRQIAQHEEQLAEARAAFRVEREQKLDLLEADREQLDQLQRETAERHHEATRGRDRLRKLSARFLGRMRRKWHNARKVVALEQTKAEDTRSRIAAEVADFTVIRSAFYTEAAEARDRLREDWAALESHRRRTAADRTEADEYYAKQEAATEARHAELAARESALAEARRKLDQDTASLRTESTGLEARIVNARAIVEELEKKREELQAAALKPILGAEPQPLRVALDRSKDRDLTAWAAELEARDEKLAQDRAALSAFKQSLDRDATEIADRRRVLAEQFGLLTVARSAWQEAESRTVAEMEDLARDLRHREQQLDTREERLMKADGRRREDAYELWQFRLRLEGWQTKLTAVERRWHAERELREAEFTQRVQKLSLRESVMETVFSQWEQAHEQDRERLRVELRQWADDRAALVRAATEFDRQRQEALGTLATHAARAMAAEQSVVGLIHDSGTAYGKRRLEVLRKRWERNFTRLKDDAVARSESATRELAQIDTRYRELLRLLNDVVGREAALNVKVARGEFNALAGLIGEVARNIPGASPAPIASEELTALREEVERMASVLISADLPENIPWAEDVHDDNTRVLPFDTKRAA